MCIIVYKPTGQVCPSWKTLKTCFNNNPDGCGFMYAENGEVHIHKGFMSWRGFKTAFKPYKNRTDLPITLHFRITTNGATLPQNCHPFPLSSKIGELRELDLDCNVGIAHNGIISMTSYANKISDTMEFIRKYAGCIITSPTWYYNANAGKLLGEIIKSKMLVLSGDGHGEIVGDGWDYEDGIWYSNSTYKPWDERYLTYRSARTWSWEDVKAPWEEDYEDYKDYADEDYADSLIYDETGAFSCRYWDYMSPSLACLDCSKNTYCWGEEELYQIGAIV